MEANKDKERQEKARHRRERTNIALAVLILIAACMGVAKLVAASNRKDHPAGATADRTITVCISGAVMNPGSYRLTPGDTIRELVIMAGGFSEGADIESVNLTTPLDDLTADVFIPFTAEYQPPEKPPAADEVKLPLNINTASAVELQALPGIGPELAKRIVEYREKHGPFRKTSELMNVEGIGQKKYDDLFGLINIGEGLPWE